MDKQRVEVDKRRIENHCKQSEITSYKLVWSKALKFEAKVVRYR